MSGGLSDTTVEIVFVYRDGAKRCSCAPLPVVLGAVSPCVLCTPHWGLLHLRRAGWVRELTLPGREEVPTSILCVALTALGQRSGLTACRRVATSNVQSSGGRIQDTGRQCDGGRGEMARTHADDARCGAVMRGVSGTATARAG